MAILAAASPVLCHMCTNIRNVAAVANTVNTSHSSTFTVAASTNICMSSASNGDSTVTTPATTPESNSDNDVIRLDGHAASAVARVLRYIYEGRDIEYVDALGFVMYLGRRIIEIVVIVVEVGLLLL